MIKTTKLHYHYLLQVNSVITDFKKSIPVVDRDAYLNHAIDIVLENLSTVQERNNVIEDYLKDIEIKNLCLECKESEDKTYCIAELPEDYYRLTRQTAKAIKSDCKDCENNCEERILKLGYIQSDDLSESVLRDPYRTPSFNWGESFYNLSKEGIHVYKKDFDIEEVCIDYIKKLPKIAAPSLLDCEPQCYTDSEDNKVCEDVDLELDANNTLWRKFVDVAVLLTLRDLGRVDDFQSKLNSILFTEKVYIQ